MKKGLMKMAVVLVFTFALSPFSVQAAIDIFINNTWIPVEAINVNGRVLVPVRGVFEKLGYEVTYDDATKTAELFGEKEIHMRNGVKYFLCDSKEIWPDVPPQIINSRFYLPVRAVGEAIGANVSWDGANQNVYITKYVPDSSANTPINDYGYEQPTNTEQSNAINDNDDTYYDDSYNIDYGD